MQVVFRVDSSLQIGSGHLMRCLTLAECLKNDGIDICFICRKNSGNLRAKIIKKGFRLFELESSIKARYEDKPFHSKWLNVTQKEDANQCKKILEKIKPDWLVVDHYALDHEWESDLKDFCTNIMVIDDLADRKHNCDLLLDQTFGRIAEHYIDLVPKVCTLLVGAEYSLLRPDFADWRSYSIERRSQADLKNLLITMGGIDLENHTEEVLIKLDHCVLPVDINIVIVLGSHYPHLESLKMRAERSKYKINIQVDVENMAEIMANSDIAIGAAGSTSWERCCMGLPTIQVVLAENQKFLAKKLSEVNASLLVNEASSLQSLINDASKWMQDVSISSARITDGTGTLKVASQITDSIVKIKLQKFGQVELVSYVNLNSNDQAFALKMRNDISVKRWMYSQREISQREHRDFIKKLNDNQERRYFLVKLQGTIVGSINFSNIVPNDSLDFGLFTNPYIELKGAGRILEAAGNYYANFKFGVKKVKLEVFSDNTRAIKFYKKCGYSFVRSNRFQEKEIFFMEKSRDSGEYYDKYN
ncbi:UDP-2,4-diacetamido-2,4,6-trideoxy-beta-L-altropyranose hydrolase [Amylibacter sp.]|nr:UDP-2,4-diacetamido-2,4,6-trideoxy-beta-L-altropyranose hydrolase [Amylibacter sp.]